MLESNELIKKKSVYIALEVNHKNIPNTRVLKHKVATLNTYFACACKMQGWRVWAVFYGTFCHLPSEDVAGVRNVSVVMCVVCSFGCVLFDFIIFLSNGYPNADGSTISSKMTGRTWTRLAWDRGR